MPKVLVDVPGAETLAPLSCDFPRKGPPIRLGDRWEELTRGTNLALGRPYRFDRRPNCGATGDGYEAATARQARGGLPCFAPPLRQSSLH